MHFLFISVPIFMQIVDVDMVLSLDLGSEFANGAARPQPCERLPVSSAPQLDMVTSIDSRIIPNRIIFLTIHSYSNFHSCFIGMDSIVLFLIRQDKQDYQDIYLSSSISGHRPIGPMARREEIDETQSTFGGKKTSHFCFTIKLRHQKIVAALCQL
jgi:hypothetical protein